MKAVYQYRCLTCHREEEKFREWHNRNQTYLCLADGCTGQVIRIYSASNYRIAGMPSDRYRLQDKIAANRQAAQDQGW